MFTKFSARGSRYGSQQGLVEATGGLLRTSFRFDTYKYVRSDIGMGNEWLSKVPKIAQDNSALICSI